MSGVNNGVRCGQCVCNVWAIDLNNGVRLNALTDGFKDDDCKRKEEVRKRK